LTDGETNNEEQLWVITSFTEDGNAFKIANVKHGLFLCAHRRLAGPILFCHRENGESDQAWLCLPTRQDRFDLNNVSVGKVANGSWHVEHVRAFAGFSRRPAPTTPAAGSDTMGIAAAAGAAGAVLGAAAVVVGASLLATDNDENRTRNANDRRRDVQRRREQDDNTALAAAAAGAALGAVAGFSNAISYFSGTAPMSSASTPVGSSTGTAPQPTPASSGTATSPHSTPASVSTGTATQSPVRVVEERYSAAARASQTPSDGGNLGYVAGQTGTASAKRCNHDAEGWETDSTASWMQVSSYDESSSPAASSKEVQDNIDQKGIEQAVNAISSSAEPTTLKRARLRCLSSLLISLLESPSDAGRLRKYDLLVQSKLDAACFYTLELAGFCDRGDELVYQTESDEKPVLVVLAMLESALDALPPEDEEVADRKEVAGPNLPAVAEAYKQLCSGPDAAKRKEDLSSIWAIVDSVTWHRVRWKYKQLDRSSQHSLEGTRENLQLLQCAGFVRDEDGTMTFTGASSDQLRQVQDVILDLIKTAGEESIVGSSAGRVPPQIASTTTTTQRRLFNVPERRLLLHTIRFTQNSVASHFRDGRSLQETVNLLRSGMAVDDLPAIRVVECMNHLWSLDNRRLSCMKEAFPERRHADKTIPVKMEALSDPKVRDEFTRKFTTGTEVVKRDGSSKSSK